jgi:hypothetical protein
MRQPDIILMGDSAMDCGSYFNVSVHAFIVYLSREYFIIIGNNTKNGNVSMTLRMVDRYILCAGRAEHESEHNFRMV